MAEQEGRDAAFRNALRQIVARLLSDPLQAGEGLYPLTAMRLRIRTIAIRPVVVTFAVSDAIPLVFLKSVQLLGE